MWPNIAMQSTSCDAIDFVRRLDYQVNQLDRAVSEGSSSGHIVSVAVIQDVQRECLNAITDMNAIATKCLMLINRINEDGEKPQAKSHTDAIKPKRPTE